MEKCLESVFSKPVGVWRLAPTPIRMNEDTDMAAATMNQEGDKHDRRAIRNGWGMMGKDQKS
jgi:hypothetical protein